MGVNLLIDSSMSQYLKIDDIIECCLERSMDFSFYSKAQLFSNENLKLLERIVDFKDNSVFGIMGSGGFGLNAVLNGAKRIDLFDISVVNAMFTELKYSSVKNLSYDDFFKFYPINGTIFNKDLYSGVRDDLSEISQNFFDSVMGNYVDDFYFRLYDSDLSYISYLKNKDNYDATKRNLPSTEVNLHLDDFCNVVSKIKQEYDIGYFSNVFDYLNVGVVRPCLDVLKKGQMVFFGSSLDLIEGEVSCCGVDYNILKLNASEADKFQNVAYKDCLVLN